MTVICCTCNEERRLPFWALQCIFVAPAHPLLTAPRLVLWHAAWKSLRTGQLSRPPSCSDWESGKRRKLPPWNVWRSHSGTARGSGTHCTAYQLRWLSYLQTRDHLIDKLTRNLQLWNAETHFGQPHRRNICRMCLLPMAPHGQLFQTDPY